MLSKVHLPVPVGHERHPGTLISVPLMCGMAWEHSTRVSYAHEKITCGRCQRLLAKFLEDLEHRRNMMRMEMAKDRAALQEQLAE